MHTEEEAKAKWCPQSRVLYVGKSGIQQYPNNRVSTPEDGVNANPQDCRCIASACMAWRWTDTGHLNPLTGVWERLPKGCCGLAGRLA